MTPISGGAPGTLLECFWAAPGGLPGVFLGCTWAFMGALWVLLECSRDVLRVLMGCVWGAFGVFLGCSWGVFGVFLGCSWDAAWGLSLAASWLHLGGSKSVLGARFWCVPRGGREVEAEASQTAFSKRLRGPP